MKTVKDKTGSYFGLRGRVLTGSVLAVGLIAGVGGWAATTPLAGAVIASGVVAVDQNLKLVQHLDGGIISSILVREGSRVREGDVMFQLDDAQTRAELEILRGQLIKLKIQQARLAAERDGRDALVLPAAIDVTDPAIAGQVAGEQRILSGRLGEYRARRQQFELSIEQVAEEIRGLEAQALAKREEAGLVQEEQTRSETLMKAGLAEIGRVAATRRELARLTGESGEIAATIARARVRSSEIRLQILAADDLFRTEAQRGLGQTEIQIDEMEQRFAATADRLTRTELRAPISGIVNELNVHTLGGVIGAAEVLATIMPDAAQLTFQVRVPPVQIDQVVPEQSARVRFPAFNQRVTPELAGTTRYVAAAATRDPVSGESFFLAEIGVEASALAALEGAVLLPGMPVEVFIATEPRMAISYLAKPFTDVVLRAFRER
ncbi:HlyD family type I secretion periplasmic adaptor subunit [Falsigemmobacter faecalis]|uniref:Membrane fusion protein (MFP) family protein n=1 Tax=Falsigemmobacter faecalis TaxID=2488730 RepID=A0A3P3D3Q9_9RHOB|nr:HlyD family type I secretion periplasmic adaptor subunit [Falsigemmobacter faecalis]RRH69050.1 HlyD family type I secretion periplasmic adaptor subunit [Falsigemmobacter faecalis]